MSSIKTVVNDSSVEDFINTAASGTKRDDSFVLLDLFTKVTGAKAKMWS